MNETTETVVVVDANAAHKLIGRSIGGVEIDHYTDYGRAWSIFGFGGVYLGGGDYGNSAEVDALPPATMRMAWYDAITDGAKIVHPTGYIVGGWVRRVPTTGLLWIEGEGQDPRVVADDDGMVEVLAPVPEVEVADEVTVRRAAEWLVAIYSPLDFTEPRIAEAWDGLVNALAADRGEA